MSAVDPQSGQAIREHKYVYTVSIEKVLSPFAERVSQLVLIVADARETNAPLPDLTDKGTAVHLAGIQLRDVAKDTMTGGDDMLLKEMDNANKQLEVALGVFNAAVMALKEDPFDEVASQELINGVRGLLFATTDLLSSFDRYELRKIIILARQCLDVLSKLSGSQQEDWTARTIQGVVDCVEKGTPMIHNLHELVGQRVPELRNISHRQRLKKANDRLEERPRKLMSGAKLFVTHKDSKEAWNAMIHIVNETESVIEDIIEILLLTEIDDDTYARQGGEINENLKLARSQLTNSAPINADTLESQMSKLMTLAERVASCHQAGLLTDKYEDDDDALNDATDLETDGAPPDRAIKVEETLTEIQNDVDCLLTSAKNGDAAAADSRKDKLRDDLQALKKHLEDAAIDEIASAFVATHQPVHHLARVVEVNDEDDLDTATDNLNEQTLRMVSAAENIGAISDDTGRVVEIREKSNHLLLSSQQVVRAARLSCLNPDSDVAQKYLADAKDEYVKDSEHVHNTALHMLETKNVIDIDLEAVKSMARLAISAAKRGFPAAARSACRKMMKRVTHIIYVATMEKDNSDDEALKRSVEAVTAALAKGNEEVSETLQDLSKAPKDPVKVGNFVTAVNNVVGAIENFRGRMVEPILDDALVDVQVSEFAEEPQEDEEDDEKILNSSDQSDVDDVDIMNDPNDSMMKPLPHESKIKRGGSVADMFKINVSTPSEQEPVMEAAYALRKTAGGWLSDDNPVVATAKSMSEMMAAMVHASSLGTDGMGEIVRQAQNIAQAGKVLVKHTQDCAKNCSDKRLTGDLLSLCERIPTLGVQLKILASVKATSLSECRADEVSETNALLVVNAQNLMDAVSKALKACRAASLKPLTGPDDSTGGPKLTWVRKSKKKTTKS